MIYYLGQVFIITMIIFGGGTVFIPVLEQLLVQDVSIFTPQEYTLIITVATSLAGPIGPKISAYGGLMGYGVEAGIGAYLIFLIPPMYMMYFARKFYTKLKESKKFNLITMYIKPIIIAIFLNMILSFFKTSIINMDILNTILIFSISFYLFHFKKIKQVHLILSALAYGMLLYII